MKEQSPQGMSQAKRNLIALAIAAPLISLGAYFKSNHNDDNSKFWDWLTGTVQPIEENFISDKTQKRIVDLKGDWLFASGDELERANENFDDTAWSTVQVPSYWEDQGYKEYDGFAWYRRHFSMDANEIEKSLFAVLGTVDDVDEVFINGQKVGGLGAFPPTYVGAWDKDRNYPVPAGLLREGENVIAVRVYDAQQGGGIYKGKVGIYASTLPQPLVNLQGTWQFKLGDEGEDYKSIQVPDTWENQGYEDYNGIAWYKHSFGRLDVGENEALMLLLGKIDDTDEVTLNGELIGRTGHLDHTDRQTDPDYWRLDRRYEFSSSLLKENNILEVRVHDSTGFGGIYAGPVGIMKKSAYIEYQEELASASKGNFSSAMDWIMGRE